MKYLKLPSIARHMNTSTGVIQPTSTIFHLMIALLLSPYSHVRLCNPIDGSPPGPSVPGILQARTLEWVAISFSNACMHAKLLQSCPTLQPHRRQPTRPLRPWDSPDKNTGGVAISFSRGSTQPRDPTGVSCTAGGFFTA